MTLSLAAYVRRIRVNLEDDPARPHLVATVTASILAASTGPLVLVGLRHHVPDLPWFAGVACLVVWAGTVAAVLDVVLPWRSRILRGLRLEFLALAQIRTTDQERRRFYRRWLLLSNTVATVISAVPAMLIAGLEAVAVSGQRDAFLWSAMVAMLAAGIGSNVPTLLTCRREARLDSQRTSSEAAPGTTQGVPR